MGQHYSYSGARIVPHDKLIYARTEQQQMQLAGKLSIDTDGDYDLGMSYTALIVRLAVMFVVIVAGVFALNLSLQAWLS
jgi:hypothetical protein